MGTLSGLRTIDLKSESVKPNKKNAAIRIVAMSIDFFDHNTYNFNRRFHLSNQSLIGKIKKKTINVDVNKIVGFEIVSIICLKLSIFIPE